MIGEIGEALASLLGTKRAAGYGRPLVLRGNGGVRLRVTPLEAIDPAPGSEFFQPQRDNRLVAIVVELVNVGSTATYEDTTSNGARVLDSRGREVRATIVDAVEPGLGRPRLPPGRRQVGALSFEVPKGVDVRALQLTLDSGFGPDTAVWTLPGSR